MVFAADLDEKQVKEIFCKYDNVKPLKLDITKQDQVDAAAAAISAYGKGTIDLFPAILACILITLTRVVCYRQLSRCI